MAARTSAGILLFRRRGEAVEFFLVHHGGPYWTNKDAGAWTIPKGEFAPPEDALAAAQREFIEETGFPLAGQFIPLRPVKQAAGKIVHAWAVEGDCDASAIRSNTYRVQWPPKSGLWQSYPEVDRAGWFDFNDAKEKINQAQIALLQELLDLLIDAGGEEARGEKHAKS